jgi:hypothetical protein
VIENPLRNGEKAWIAFPQPQVTFSFHDGFTGQEMYAESILANPPATTQPAPEK